MKTVQCKKGKVNNLCPKIEIKNKGPLPDFSKVGHNIERETVCNEDVILQETVSSDGITTAVKGGDEEELDYDEADLPQEGEEVVDEIFKVEKLESEDNEVQIKKPVKIVGGQVGTSKQDADTNLQELELMKDPLFESVMEKFLSKKFQSMEEKIEVVIKVAQEKAVDSRRVVEKEAHQGLLVNNAQPLLKLPSDTTIYAPALMKNQTCNSPVVQFVRNEAGLSNSADFDALNIADQVPPLVINGNRELIVNQQTELHSNIDNVLPVMNTECNIVDEQAKIISNFVEAVRLEDMEKSRKRASELGSAPAADQAKQRTERLLAEAEKFKATIVQPTGMVNTMLLDKVSPQIPSGLNNLVQGIQIIGEGVSDDDFFHLMCHLQPGLIHKIENGEYMELEKLLPKDKNSRSDDKNRLEWVQHEGNTFLVSATNKNQKISSFCKWEQAFRIYATIYCGAHPQRAREIWQYITVINTASTAYYWDNVYNYDITFCHLMAFNPSRSWAITYNQMWNLSMHDPLPKNSRGSNFGAHTFNSANHHTQSQNNQGHSNRKKKINLLLELQQRN